MKNRRVSSTMDGEDLREIRQELGLSRVAMAKRLGISPRTLEGFEQDRVAIPVTIEQFATLLKKFASVEGKTKMDLWRMLLNEKEKNRRIKEYREQTSF